MTSTHPPSQIVARRPVIELANLDFMRAYAVITVAVVHTLLYTGHLNLVGWSGTNGVGIFFVHTTLVLMMSLERDPHLWRFYVRRAFRLYPLWWGVLLIYVLFHVPMSPPAAPQFISYLPHSIGEWFAEIILNFDFRYGARVVCASWSLPIEAQMYVVLPGLFYIAIRWRRIWPLLLIDVAAIAFDLHRFRMEVTNLPMAFPYFVPGVMAYLLFKRNHRRLPAWLFPLWLAVLVYIAHFHGNYRETWYFCLILGLSLPFFEQLTWAPLLRITHLISRYSYGIYLCHGIAIAIAVHLLASHSIVLRVAAFAATVVILPVGFYHLLERPMIVLGSKLARKIERGPSPRMDERNLSLEPAP
jgi:peptidoglycan/LPS O-acetylase OafA/YrhL